MNAFAIIRSNSALIVSTSFAASLGSGNGIGCTSSLIRSSLTSVNAGCVAGAGIERPFKITAPLCGGSFCTLLALLRRFAIGQPFRCRLGRASSACSLTLILFTGGSCSSSLACRRARFRSPCTALIFSGGVHSHAILCTGSIFICGARNGLHCGLMMSCIAASSLASHALSFREMGGIRAALVVD
ncbi:MAG: hypothetical protein E5V91_22835 [Mesorhizobium sp.]|nr:MAG: hypothetical protein E5V91_22835 [Mesorhizobium sp.]